MPKATIQQGSNKEIKDVLKVVSMLVELQDKKERNDNVYVQKEYAEKRQHLIKNVQTELQTSANHKLSEKYDILLGTKIYDIIQDLKQNTAKYLSRPAYDYQFETYQFGAIIGAGLFYGIYEYLKDNTISGKTRKDMQALESAIKEFKTTSLDCILSSRGQPIPYYFDNGVLFKRWVEEYFNKIPSKKHIDVQQQVISCFYRSNNLPVAINNDEIRFLQKNKGLVVKYAVPEILDLYLVWTLHNINKVLEQPKIKEADKDRKKLLRQFHEIHEMLPQSLIDKATKRR